MTTALFALIMGFAALIHGAAGIGFPLIATPLLAMGTDVRSAILILVLPTIVLNIANILKGGKWGRSIALYWPLALYGMAGSYLGTKLLILVPAEVFRPVLAAAVILYLNAERIGVGFSWVRSHPRIAAAVFGTLAGLLGGTVNVMLPALVIFALEIRMDKTAMIQVFNFCFLFGKLTQGAVFVSAGLLTMEILKTAVPLAVFSLLVMLAAMKIRNRLPEDTYRRWLRILLYIMAGVLLIQSITG
ncbi:MAG: sulfite exporter TauE/SafE family protein [Desulfobacterales bacterium]|nr:sulfite exporter TauE/SafE family protein [Desulfobacterales bacterium]